MLLYCFQIHLRRSCTRQHVARSIISIARNINCCTQHLAYKATCIDSLIFFFQPNVNGPSQTRAAKGQLAA